MAKGVDDKLIALYVKVCRIEKELEYFTYIRTVKFAERIQKLDEERERNKLLPDHLKWKPLFVDKSNGQCGEYAVLITKTDDNYRVGKIGSTEYGFTVYAKDADPCLIVEYTGGDGGVILFHMDVKTVSCFATNKDGREEISYIKGGLKDWYEDNKERLIEDYHSGRYSVLPEWE